MTDTTTINIPEDLRDELKERKDHPKEPYYSVIQRELGEQPDHHVSDELTEVLHRMGQLESAVREATQAAQAADRKLEELQ